MFVVNIIALKLIFIKYDDYNPILIYHKACIFGRFYFLMPKLQFYGI